VENDETHFPKITSLILTVNRTGPVMVLFCIILSVWTSTAQDLLTTPLTGPKSRAMGGTGCAVVMDGGSVRLNPALLGIEDRRWEGGEFQYYRKPILEDIVPCLYTISSQEEALHNLGITAYLAVLRHEMEQVMNRNGRPVSVGCGYDDRYLFGGGAGYCLDINTHIENSLGIAVKYYREVSGSESEGIFLSSSVFSFDLGYVLRVLKRVSLGASLLNSGPHMKWIQEGVSIYSIPQPTQLHCGIGYKDGVNYDHFRILDYSLEISHRWILRREYREYNNDIFRAGAEAVFLRTPALRAGYETELHETDPTKTLSTGVGLSILNHFEFDLFLSRKNKFESLNPRFGFAVTLKRALEWEKWDRKWWLVRGSDSH